MGVQGGSRVPCVFRQFQEVLEGFGGSGWFSVVPGGFRQFHEVLQGSGVLGGSLWFYEVLWGSRRF